MVKGLRRVRPRPTAPDTDQESVIVTDSSSDRRLDVLIAEYEALREDERMNTTLLATLAGAGVTLIGGAVVLLAGRNSTPGWLFAFVPLPGFIVLAYGAVAGALGTVRSYYLRLVEQELFKYGGVTMLGDRAIPTPSFAHLELSVTRPGVRSGPFGVANIAVLLGILSVFAGATAWCLSRTTPTWLAVTASVGYVTAIFLVLKTINAAALHGRELWVSSLDSLEDSWGTPPASTARPRRTYVTLGRLLLPRPYDLVKCAFVPAGYLLAVAFAPGTPRDLWAAAAAFVVFELIVYQGRYLWNDLRNRLDDQQHPDVKKRNRITIRTTKDVRIVVATLLVRTSIWIAAGIALGGWEGSALLVSGGVVIGESLAYERLRRHTRRLEVDGGELRLARMPMRLLYLLVGFGYAVRVATGALLGLLEIDVSFVLHIGVTAWALGSMFVTMTWVYEGTSFLTSSIPGFVPSLANTKAHLVPLLCEAGLLPLKDRRDKAVAFTVASSKPRDAARPLSAYPALADETGLRCTWNRYFVLAAVSGCALAILIANGHGNSGATSSTILALATALTVALLLSSVSLLANAIIVGVLLAATTIWAVVAASSGDMYLLLAMVPVVIYMVFRSTNYEALFPTISIHALIFGMLRVFDQVAGVVAGPGRVTTEDD
jgi:hypothetical protein